jgi:gluconolactonase
MTLKQTITPLLIILLISQQVISQETRELAIHRPFAVVDLKNATAGALVQSKWQVCNTEIRDVSFKAPAPSASDAHPIYPNGKAITTHNIYPSLAELGKASWVSVSDLDERQGNGKLSFVWYRTKVSLPQSLGSKSIDGSSVYFEITADDYSEIYVDGKLKKQFGQTGAGVISGYNARNRVLLSNKAQAGQQFDIAVLVINGNVGDLPDNYVWIRNAVLDFYSKEELLTTKHEDGSVSAVEKSFDNIIQPGTRPEKLADGFSFTEGPVWHPDGFLLFSDPNMNMIYRYNPVNNNVTIYQSHSGYTGLNIGEIGQPGSNGLAIDNEGRLIVCQHGNRRVIRHELKGPITIISDRCDGKRLNSPNDIVLKSDGTVYFTDPPYGLPKFYEDPEKELSYQGVFMVKNGITTVVAKDCGGPNGIAFSPDEHFLYVSNWDIRDIHHTKDIWRYEVKADGTLTNGKVFYSFNYTLGDEALDGLKVDLAGNIFCSAPGGVYIISPAAQLLGKIECTERPANMAWGDADGKTLYMTAHTGLYKIRTLTGGKIVMAHSSNPQAAK